MRFGSVPYKNQTKTLQDRMVGVSNHPQFVGQQWKGGEMSSWKENFPAAKVFNMWTSKWTSSDESTWFHGHRLHRWSRFLDGSCNITAALLCCCCFHFSQQRFTGNMFHRSSVRMVCFRSLAVLRSTSFFKTASDWAKCFPYCQLHFSFSFYCFAPSLLFSWLGSLLILGVHSVPFFLHSRVPAANFCRTSRKTQDPWRGCLNLSTHILMNFRYRL